MSYSHFFSQKLQHICISLDVNFNKSLANDIVSFEQLGPGVLDMLSVGRGRSKISSFMNVHAGLGLFCLHVGIPNTNL